LDKVKVKGKVCEFTPLSHALPKASKSGKPLVKATPSASAAKNKKVPSKGGNKEKKAKTQKKKGPWKTNTEALTGGPPSPEEGESYPEPIAKIKECRLVDCMIAGHYHRRPKKVGAKSTGLDGAARRAAEKTKKLSWFLCQTVAAHTCVVDTCHGHNPQQTIGNKWTLAYVTRLNTSFEGLPLKDLYGAVAIPVTHPLDEKISPVESNVELEDMVEMFADVNACEEVDNSTAPLEAKTTAVVTPSPQSKPKKHVLVGETKSPLTEPQTVEYGPDFTRPPAINPDLAFLDGLAHRTPAQLRAEADEVLEAFEKDVPEFKAAPAAPAPAVAAEDGASVLVAVEDNSAPANIPDVVAPPEVKLDGKHTVVESPPQVDTVHDGSFSDEDEAQEEVPSAEELAPIAPHLAQLHPYGPLPCPYQSEPIYLSSNAMPDVGMWSALWLGFCKILPGARTTWEYVPDRLYAKYTTVEEIVPAFHEQVTWFDWFTTSITAKRYYREVAQYLKSAGYTHMTMGLVDPSVLDLLYEDPVLAKRLVISRTPEGVKFFNSYLGSTIYQMVEVHKVPLTQVTCNTVMLFMNHSVVRALRMEMSTPLTKSGPDFYNRAVRPPQLTVPYFAGGLAR
jgi:hypothetical protein